MRSAIFKNRVFGGITRKKIFIFWILLILSVARLVIKMHSAGGMDGTGCSALTQLELRVEVC
jgi:hypothetical protein